MNFNKREIKIMTFNIQHCENYIEHKINFNAIAEAVKNSGADIVGLNEVRGKGISTEYENQTGILSELTGLENQYFAKAIDFDGVNPYGNALLTRYALKSAETIVIPDPAPKTGCAYYETRCILKAKLENSLTVMVVHFGLNEDEQKNAVDMIIKNMETEKCILMGDFNVTPDNAVLNPIRERMKDAADCFEGALFSFPSDRPDRKIDYIFATPDIKIIKADIPDMTVSDHRPHTAVISIE